MELSKQKHPAFIKTEELLKKYNENKIRLTVLEIEIAELDKPIPAESLEETIAGVYYQRAGEGGMPASGAVSDKTCNCAVAFRRANSEVNHDIEWQIICDKANAESERDAIVVELQKIDAVIESLGERQRVVVREFYFNGRDWESIARKVNYSKMQCQRLRDKAVVLMTKAIFNTVVI